MDLYPSKNSATITAKSDYFLNAKTVNDLVLDGDEAMVVEEISINDKKLAENSDFTLKPCEKTGELKLTVLASALPADGKFSFFQKISYDPEKNKSCMGLYTCKTNGEVDGKTVEQTAYSTQMEAEGFRKFMFYPDRPDVLATYKCKVTAPNDGNFPTLLSNGNKIESGECENGSRIFAVFDDPFPKPSYLFALVAGNLSNIETTFDSKLDNSRKNMSLNVYAEKSSAKYLDFSLEALKKSFQFDEDYFGLVYDLDIFNVVAVREFNMGAMENKSLNIFNERLILADPEVATDEDYITVCQINRG